MPLAETYLGEYSYLFHVCCCNSAYSACDLRVIRVSRGYRSYRISARFHSKFLTSHRFLAFPKNIFFLLCSIVTSLTLPHLDIESSSQGLQTHEISNSVPLFHISSTPNSTPARQHLLSGRLHVPNNDIHIKYGQLLP